MIGIICAMHEEKDAILALMKDVKVKNGKNLLYHGGQKLDNRYYVGKIGEKDVVLVRSGVGKVYAAIVATLLIDKFKPELVINLGCAGSLSKDVRINDIVVSTRVADWDVIVPGWERSMYSDKLSYECDKRTIDTCKKIKTNINIHYGAIVSGDEFIYKKSQINEIKKYFPESLCGEMEGSSIANTCYAYKTPVAIIRSISDDTLVKGNEKSFNFNLDKVVKTAAIYCEKLIKRY